MKKLFYLLICVCFIGISSCNKDKIDDLEMQNEILSARIESLLSSLKIYEGKINANSEFIKELEALIEEDELSPEDEINTFKELNNLMDAITTAYEAEIFLMFLIDMEEFSDNLKNEIIAELKNKDIDEGDPSTTPIDD
jgi:hypothetical protein